MKERAPKNLENHKIKRLVLKGVGAVGLVGGLSTFAIVGIASGVGIGGPLVDAGLGLGGLAVATKGVSLMSPEPNSGKEAKRLVKKA